MCSQGLSAEAGGEFQPNYRCGRGFLANQGNWAGYDCRESRLVATFSACEEAIQYDHDSGHY
jgi:hypothetical protein